MKLTSPLDIAHGFAEAWNDGDADALADLFVEDADFINVVGLWWEDRQAIRQAHARGFRVMFGTTTMELERTKVRMLSDGIAVVHALWHMTGQRNPQGRTVGDRDGVFTFVVVRREPDGWRAVAAQNTDHIPGTETLVADGQARRPASYLGAPPISSRSRTGAKESADRTGDD